MFRLKFPRAHVANRRQTNRAGHSAGLAGWLLILLTLLAPSALRAQGPVVATTTVTSQDGIMQASTSVSAATPQFHPSRLLVKFRNGARGFLAGSGSSSSFRHDTDLFLVNTPPGLSVPAAIAQYQANPNVVYAEPDHLVSIIATPNDPLWNDPSGNKQWDMLKIKADLAWNTQTSATDVYVAVIDTGVNETHPDLIGNVVQGWNCINAGAADGTPGCQPGQIDDHGHGTHVAGTIGAVGNNGVGMAGINWQAKIVGFKFLNSGGSGYTSDAIYAFNKIGELKQAGTNFRVTNNSWGGGGFDQALKDAMAANEALGIVHVCAAGNNGQNADFAPMWPGAYNNRGIISVLASDSNDVGAGFTNYGLASVDIAAPGVSTLSTVPTGACSLCDATGYKLLSGTSMASPHVAGAVAAMFQRNLDLKAASPGTVTLLTDAAIARDIMLAPANYDALADAKAKSTSTGGRLNLQKLLASSMLTTPPTVLNNFPTITTGGNIFASGGQQVTVSASGSDADAGDVSGLRFNWGKSSPNTWLFGSMLYSLFPIPPANPYQFTTPMVGRTALETYMASVSDNRGGGASGAQYVTVSPVASTLGGPDGAFSICETGAANCANSGGAISVTRNDNCGTVANPVTCALVSVNYSPLDLDNKGTPKWDSWYSTNGGVGGNCCYSGPSMTRGFTGAGAFRISVNSADWYLETSPTTTAGRKTAIVRVDGAAGTPPLAQLSSDVVGGSAPLTVNFTMAGTQAFDGKTIQWYFMGCGEGFLYGKAIPTHTCVFNTPGTYWVENLVADSGGMDDVVNIYIVVTPPNGGGGGDTTKPTASITSPTQGASITGPVNLAATAADNMAVSSVEFFQENGATDISLGTDSTAPYGISWNPGPGTYQVYAVATDSSNNKSENPTLVGFTVLALPAKPTIDDFKVTPAPVKKGTSTIAAKVTAGTGASISKVEFYINNVLVSTDTTVNASGPLQGYYTHSWKVPAAAGKTYNLKAIAYDNSQPQQASDPAILGPFNP